MCDCTPRKKLIHLYWLTTFALFAAAIVRLVFYTPDEVTMGPIQKIFYLHLPVAIATGMACMVTFIAGIGYLIKREMFWDDLSSAAARISVQLCAVVLLTGMIWGKSAWGQWWTWSPRLTFSLILWLLYLVYLTVRMSIESKQRRAVISAVYAIIAFLDVPLVWLSTKLMPDIHPQSIELAGSMKITLAMWFVPVFMMAAGLLIAKFKLNERIRVAEIGTTAAFEPVMSAKFQYQGGVA